MAQETFRMMSLNLHGYHPTGELRRYFEDKQGSISKAPAHIHYFTLDEIIQGHARRIRQLSYHIRALRPDLIFFQEVGAGSPFDSFKNCETFYHRFNGDSDWENTALRLEKKLAHFQMNYQTILACRGNIGWFTGPEEFNYHNIVVFSENDPFAGKKKMIFQAGDNPYPQGILVEGFAVMVSEKFRVLDHQLLTRSYNFLGDTVFFQMVALSLADQQNYWFLAVNVQNGQKMAGLEQAVVIRKAVYEYLSERHHEGECQGVLIGGDFSESCFRCHVSSKDENVLNRSLFSMYSVLEKAIEENKGKPFGNVDGSVKDLEGVDFLFATENFKVENAFSIYSSYTTDETKGVTERPGIYAELMLIS